MRPSILIVDDEPVFLESVVRLLRLEGYEDLTAVANALEVPRLLETRSFDLALLDVTMPGLDGISLLEIVKEQCPTTECVMVTAHDDVPTVVRAIRRGALDYLVKPIVPDQLAAALDRALERRRLVASLLARDEADTPLKDRAAFGEFVTADPTTLRLLREAELHAASDIPILVTGETGVGKEVLARGIHRASPRRSGPFVAVNMLAISPSLFESEFFGHTRGAFTGADRDRAGWLAQAKGGTLFLDEIGDLPLDIQGKLLRILQEREYVPVGSTRPLRADVRYVAATNQDLVKLVEQRRFRKDLFYRLRFAHLAIPPLAERLDDVPLLAETFLSARGRGLASLTPEAEDALGNYSWPGNVRELRGCLEAAANLAEKGAIRPEHLRLPARTRREVVHARGVVTTVGQMEPLETVERRHILAVYDAVGGNKSQAARVLEIGLQTLHRKLKAWDVP